jgi:hypothetical protein
MKRSREYWTSVKKCVVHALMIFFAPLVIYPLVILQTRLQGHQEGQLVACFTLAAISGLDFIWLLYWPSTFRKMNEGRLPLWVGSLGFVLVVFLLLLLLLFLFISVFHGS